jgi:hypothetical protein
MLVSLSSDLGRSHAARFQIVFLTVGGGELNKVEEIIGIGNCKQCIFRRRRPAFPRMGVRCLCLRVSMSRSRWSMSDLWTLIVFSTGFGGSPVLDSVDRKRPDGGFCRHNGCF